MSSQQKQDVRNRIAANEKAHAERIEAASESQKSKTSKFGDQLSDLDADYRKTFGETSNNSANHAAQMNLVKAANDAQNQQAQVLHSERMKDERKANARELEALQNAKASQQKALLEQQNEVRQLLEQKRQQQNKEDTEAIAAAQREREATRLMANAEEKARMEFKQNVGTRQNAEQIAMKEVEQAAKAAEGERQEQHAKTQRAIGFAQVNSIIAMNNAEHQAKLNRDASEKMESIGSELNALRTSFNTISSKITVANDLGNPNILKNQYTMILRTMERMKANGIAASNQIGEVVELTIDKDDKDRRAALGELKTVVDGKTLCAFYVGIETLAPQKDAYLDDEFLKNAMDVVNKAENVIELIKSTWEMVPPIDRTNLVHQEFVNITNQITSGSTSSALFAAPTPAAVQEKPENEAIEGGNVDEKES